MCAVLAVLPRSGSQLPPQPRSIEDVVIPFALPCFRSIAASLTKYASRSLPLAGHPIQWSGWHISEGNCGVPSVMASAHGSQIREVTDERDDRTKE